MIMMAPIHCKVHDMIIHRVYIYQYSYYIVTTAKTKIDYTLKLKSRIGVAMVSVLSSSAVYRSFEPWSGQNIKLVYLASWLITQH